jgi:hypothetical protein
MCGTKLLYSPTARAGILTVRFPDRDFVFNGQVAIVSINPEARWAVAVSFNDAQMKRFRIPEVKQRWWTAGPDFITSAIKYTDRTKSGVWTSATEYVL